jgi:small GTP-binding protein
MENSLPEERGDMMTSCFKLLLIGDGGVGKTALAQRYASGTFNPDTRMTIGTAFQTKRLIVDGEDVVLQVWDLGGEGHFRFILPAFCAGAGGVIFAYDLTRYETLLHARDWMEILAEKVRGIPAIMVGTKVDIARKRAVKVGDATEIATKFSFTRIIETSAKTGQNVEQAFKTITRLMLASPTSPKFQIKCEKAISC